MRFLILFLPIFLFAQIVMPIQKGWQLVGLPQSVDSLELFEATNVELIWSFNASTQSWEGYSSDEAIKQKLINKNIPTINSLSSNQGFWILSKEEWVLEFDKKDKVSQNSQSLELKKGWNLISLPIGITLSPTFFEKDILWKYSKENEWENFNVDNNSSVDESRVSSISNSDGIWIYSDEEKTIDLSTQTIQMHNFNTKEELEASIQEMLLTYARPYYGCFDFLVANLTPVMDGGMMESDTEVAKVSVDDASSTNIQEIGVDESDVVKHDNNNIFYLHKSDSVVYISDFNNLLLGVTEPTTSINLSTEYYPDSLYLNDDVLVVLYSNEHNFIYDLEAKSEIAYYPTTNKLHLEFYDVSDIKNIKLKKSFDIDGSLYDSRLIDNKLYLFSSFSPEITTQYPKIYIDKTCDNYEIWKSDNLECYNANYDYEKKQYFKYDYDKPTIVSKNLLPTISGSEKSLIEASNTYAPVVLNQRANITTISEFDLVTATFSNALSFIGDSSTLYASTSSLYITSHQYPYYYDFYSYKEQTVIYKIGLNPLKMGGRGVVDGRILNQFSLSEYDNILRIATTQGYSWQGDTSNTIATLQEQNSTLVTLGVSQSLGEKAEEIKSVRFIKDKAYLVTFRQTDPLYTIDLSDPKTPKKVGELHINGYSEYIHPVSDTQLLTLGRDTDDEATDIGLSLQLFDVSDMSNPLLIDKLTFGSSSSYSIAEYDHKAFSYLGSASLFGLPYQEWTYQDNKLQFNYYQLQNNQIKSLGEMDISDDKGYYNDSIRGLFFTSETKNYLVVFSQGKFYFKEIGE